MRGSRVAPKASARAMCSSESRFSGNHLRTSSLTGFPYVARVSRLVAVKASSSPIVVGVGV